MTSFPLFWQLNFEPPIVTEATIIHLLIQSKLNEMTRIRNSAIQRAVVAIKEKKLSFRKAAESYHVAKSTLWDHLNRKVPTKYGPPRKLTDFEERAIVEVIQQCADWGAPFTKTQVRNLIKYYCDKRGINIFKSSNLPSLHYVNDFIRRHQLSMRSAGNIKRARSSVSPEQINAFFDNMTILRDFPATNISNYDETCLSDDPGKKMVVVKTGTKRVETVRDHSKVATSLMVCGSAAGELIPPMTVYKSQNLYENWTTNGPTGAIYACSKSGWFDKDLFEQWFMHFISCTSHIEGTKILIGDNLQSHFSPTVLRLAQLHDVYFTSFPANATHLMQPLDVAFFRSMKFHWKQIVEKWRLESRKTGNLPKEYFPYLLGKLWDKLLNDNGKQNLQSAFKATGLYPLDRTQVLKRLPGNENIVDNSTTLQLLNDSVLDVLKENRGWGENNQKRNRGKKVEYGRNLAIDQDDMEPPTGDTELNSVIGEKIIMDEDISADEEDEDEDKCFKCNYKFRGYKGPDWVQCISCFKWFCGKCYTYCGDFKCNKCVS